MFSKQATSGESGCRAKRLAEENPLGGKEDDQNSHYRSAVEVGGLGVGYADETRAAAIVILALGK